MSDALLDELLAKPVGPQLSSRATEPSDFTSKIEVSGERAELTINVPEGEADESTGNDYLVEEGLEPSEWEAVAFRKVKYGSVDNPMESVTFSYKKVRPQSTTERIPLDELFEVIERYEPVAVRPTGSHGAIVGIGDMQFGKIDGDGPAGTLQRTIEGINRTADAITTHRKWVDIGHIHVGWMGDHVEGFVSQGGANVWRTQLTMNEQIRLTRRVMLHALEVFAPMAQKVTFAAVPGNHGEPQRFEGSGITRYDDSHDTESLIAVADAAALAPEKFGHVEFFVPETDELVVVNEVAGTVLVQAHGHTWKPSKHFEWWSDQSFRPESGLHGAHVLMAGHLHHEEIDTWGDRTYIGVPALEDESTWFRHRKGVGGSPGIFLGITKDGAVPVKHIIR